MQQESIQSLKCNKDMIEHSLAIQIHIATLSMAYGHGALLAVAQAACICICDQSPTGRLECRLGNILRGFLDVNIQNADENLGTSLATCPLGYIIAGYQARAGASGIQYLDVSPFM